ncbi:5'/3'-nucleotidase SurE [Streptomyces sp. NPDC058424]|uniref:5'/3'-nucleotidase SurE n=1 Tax=Streptomyces sp. NPDC058424 TaxID=3346491 RepID=UPI0036527BDB
MKILVTNDDGIHGPGLHALAAALSSDGHTVMVAGPASQCSGSAAGLGTVEHEAVITVDRRSLDGLEDVPALAIHAPPALAVRAACTGTFGPVPDLVVSGVNPGFNTGRLLLHSGTVGAAATAASLDVCGVAVSTVARPVHGFTTAAAVATRIARSLSEADLPPIALNVNVPDLPLHRLAGAGDGAVRADTVSGVDFGVVEGGLRVRRSTKVPPFAADTDSDLLARGLVSVSNVALPWWCGAFDTAAVLTDLRAGLPVGR